MRRRNPKIIKIVDEMRERFTPSRSLSEELEGAVDPGILLARAARDAGRAEVMAAYEAALARLTPLDGTTPSLPPEDPDTPIRRADVIDYLDQL